MFLFTPYLPPIFADPFFFPAHPPPASMSFVRTCAGLIHYSCCVFTIAMAIPYSEDSMHSTPPSSGSYNLSTPWALEGGYRCPLSGEGLRTHCSHHPTTISSLCVNQSASLEGLISFAAPANQQSLLVASTPSQPAGHLAGQTNAAEHRLTHTIPATMADSQNKELPTILV